MIRFWSNTSKPWPVTAALPSMRKMVALIAAGALLLALMVSLPGNSYAANLTGGTYTYVINGEEETFAFDPVNRKDGLLLPAEVFQRFGVTVEGALTRTISLKKADLVAELTLGSTTFALGGQPEAVATAPLRLNGRLFLPADLLRHFGVEFSLDGTFVVMRDYVDGQPTVNQLSDADFSNLKSGRTLSASTKTDTNIYLTAEFTLLNEEMLAAANLDLSYGTRARLQGLVKTNTLVMVKLSNYAFKSGALVTSGVYLVDDKRNQYDLVSTADFGKGLITGKIAPGADRTGVLVFPKITGNAGTLTVYYDSNGGALGSFTSLK